MKDAEHRRSSPSTAWLTGLSGAGKSTLAQSAAHLVRRLGYPVCVVDGDQLRQGLCKDLGYGVGDRSDNIRRAAEIACLLNDQGIVVIVAMITPLHEQRALARAIVGAGRFAEVHVKADLATCERRDPKGLYARVRQGRVSEFTGISSVYEVPECPDLLLDTAVISVDDGAKALVHILTRPATVRRSGMASLRLVHRQSEPAR